MIIRNPNGINFLRHRVPILKSLASADRGRQPATSAISAVKANYVTTGDQPGQEGRPSYAVSKPWLNVRQYP
jgi:hypothetical protein